METASEQFDRLLKKHVAPTLKEAGFRRTGQTFRRRSGANWLVVNLQRSAYSSAGEVVYTVNLGVASARLTTFGSGDPEKPPSEPACHLRVRLGRLLTGRDEWRTLDHETALSDRSGERLALDLTETALPHLERHATDEAIRDFWLDDRTERHVHWRDLSVLLSVLGPAPALKEVLDEQKHRYKFNATRLGEIAAHETRIRGFASTG